jgi:hypothetical protein
MESLQQLAELLRQRNRIDDAIADIIGRPAEKGHIGEYIAATVFDVQLCNSATNPGSDGYFRSGALEGKSVDIKYLSHKAQSGKWLDRKQRPDFYLVLTGPRTPAGSSKGQKRSFVIAHVFLFARSTILSLNGNSIPLALWESAEIYPQPINPLLTLTERQREMLRLFGSAG